MRYLVTGASGLLGAVLLRRLRADGADVRAWSGATPGEVAGVPLRPVDLGDPAALAAAFQADRPGVVLHAAALARVGDCQRYPERARRVNEHASARLADLAAVAGARLL